MGFHERSSIFRCTKVVVFVYILAMKTQSRSCRGLTIDIWEWNGLFISCFS